MTAPGERLDGRRWLALVIWLTAQMAMAGVRGAEVGALPWLERATANLIDGCRVRADDGTWMFTPDGKGNYRALWTRDFAYMVEHAGDLMDSNEVEAALEALFRGIRADGATPDRVQPDGVAVYAGGPADRPLGEPNLDNGPFLMIGVDAYLRRLPAVRARACFVRWRRDLARALEWVPRSPAGLVWNDPRKPHSPYGFTDTVGKTGELFFESLLYWDACRRIESWEGRIGERREAREWRRRSREVERGIARLWDDRAGAFLAATEDCRQIDVWGNAFAIWLEFPLGRKERRVTTWLVSNRERFLWHGQVRHLVQGEYWQRLLAPVQQERYQNGAYWATASGWMMYATQKRDPAAARAIWKDLVADLQRDGICECVNAGYRQLPSYVVSAANPLAAARRLGYR